MILTSDECVVVYSQLTEEEITTLEANPAAMRAVIDGSGTVPLTPHWLKFYKVPNAQFCGGIAMLNILPNPLQVEFHLFYLSTAPKLLARKFCELAYIYCLLHRLQPYTVIQAKPELQYMVNFLRRLGTNELPRHGKYFFMLDAGWEPKTVKDFKVYYNVK